jgi:F-type H+-transporting ATPase subunit delta
MIHAASRAALADLRARLIEVQAGRAGGDAERQGAVARELYAAADLLARQPRLRRTLADASTDNDRRSDLVRSLFAGRIGETALGLVSHTVSLRWSSPWDLADALEIVADDLLLSVAELNGELDEVEDELFRFERILAGEGELVGALDEGGVPAERRRVLLNAVLQGKVRPVTLELLGHAVASDRKRSLLLAVDDLLEASAVRRRRSVARVVSATGLTEGQAQRLAGTLSGIYGRPINVRTAVDPAVRGGLLVRVGDEVIDGTVATRLAAARAALTG